MIGLKELLWKEQNRLEKILIKTREELDNAPPGKLRISRNKKWVQYYHCIKGEKRNGVYIPISEKKLVYQLAQKAYNEELLKLVRKRLVQIESIIDTYDDQEIEKIYRKQNKERQKLIHPIEPTWEDQLAEWMKEDYKKKEFQENSTVIITERGERVRSKSEKILADYFYQKNIPYKYEAPLYLVGAGIIYPDFTFLSSKTRQEIYWEHEGMMDDEIYARNAIRKIHTYEKNGIYPGERLILTFETKAVALDTQIVKELVCKYL